MHRTTTLAMIAGLTLAGAVGCVSQSRHDALQAELKKTREALTAKVDQRAATIRTLAGTLAERDKKIRQLDQQIAMKRQKLANLAREGDSRQEEIRRLEAELAAVIKDRSRLKQSSAQLQAALADVQRRKEEADRRVQQYRDLLARFKRLIDAGQLRVKIADGRMVLELSTDVLFPSGSAKLSDTGKQAIDEVAKVLVTLPERKFQIEGHTDNVPIRTARFPSNWELAAERALGVVKAMIDQGMPGDRVSAASFGAHRPVASNESDEGRAANRRIEIIIVPDLSSLPGFDELQRAVTGR